MIRIRFDGIDLTGERTFTLYKYRDYTRNETKMRLKRFRDAEEERSLE